MAPSIASVPLMMKKQSCRSPGASSPSSSARAPRSGSSSSCERERHALELRLHRAHDLRVVDARRVDAVAAQAVDEAAAGDVLEVRAAAAPLDGRELAALGHRLAVLEVALVVVEAEVVEGVGHDLAPLVVVQLVGVDDREPAAALVDELLPAHPDAVHGGRGRLGGLPARRGFAAVLFMRSDRLSDARWDDHGPGHDRLPRRPGSRGPRRRSNLRLAGLRQYRGPGIPTCRRRRGAERPAAAGRGAFRRRSRLDPKRTKARSASSAAMDDHPGLPKMVAVAPDGVKAAAGRRPRGGWVRGGRGRRAGSRKGATASGNPGCRRSRRSPADRRR